MELVIFVTGIVIGRVVTYFNGFQFEQIFDIQGSQHNLYGLARTYI